MSTGRSYPNAPITEAIIDLQLRLPGDATLAELHRVGAELLTDYPQQSELIVAAGKGKSDDRSGSPRLRPPPRGWKLSSADGKQIAQIRADGFTFSRLAPYEHWTTFRNEARRTWTVFRTLLHPESVERLAVRYINRIDVPATEIDMKDYFRTFPEIAPELPQKLDGYFMQLRLPLHEISASCLINQTIIPSSGPESISFVLDIDLFRLEGLPQDEAGIWEYFEKLHLEKNRIFEACITNSTRNLFGSCPS